jgi:hypothetical protein
MNKRARLPCNGVYPVRGATGQQHTAVSAVGQPNNGRHDAQQLLPLGSQPRICRCVRRTVDRLQREVEARQPVASAKQHITHLMSLATPTDELVVDENCSSFWLTIDTSNMVDKCTYWGWPRQGAGRRRCIVPADVHARSTASPSPYQSEYQLQPVSTHGSLSNLRGPPKAAVALRDGNSIGAQ